MSRDYARELHFQMQAMGLEPVTEYRFDSLRKWRADFAFPDDKLLIEYEGGIYSKIQGRHTRGKGFEGDLEKYNTATLLGFRVLRFSAKHVKSGKALQMIKNALGR